LDEKVPLNFLGFRKNSDNPAPKKASVKSGLADFWDVRSISEEGLVSAEKRSGFMLELEGIDGSFMSEDQLSVLHNEWRSILRLLPGEEIQIIYRKRVQFAEWVERQMKQAMLSESVYGRRLLLDRLADQVELMSQDQPRLLSQKILVCFWANENLLPEDLLEKRSLLRSLFSSMGTAVRVMDRKAIDTELSSSVQDLAGVEMSVPEWPAVTIEAGQIKINQDRFRSLELTKLAENFTELGMIQSMSELPYPLDICVRLKARDIQPIVQRLERKRNVLNSKRGHKNSPSPQISNQIEQIDEVLQCLAVRSESIFDLQMTVGLRFPPELASFQRKAMSSVSRAAARMNFCEMEESTVGTFDSFLECLPIFSGKNIKTHTVLGSSAIHFLPLFRPSKGDARQVVSFHTPSSSLYSLDPVDKRLANYNWLVSGTSGAGKSFFVNSLLAQSSSLNPSVFIIDIGGSYNKLTQFLGGTVMSLEPGQGFELSPFFLAPSEDLKEEHIRRQHIFQIFLEMTRVDGQLPGIEIRHLLSELLEPMMDLKELPARPVTFLIEQLAKIESAEAKKLHILLQAWGGHSFGAQFLDNNRMLTSEDQILTFDLKGLTEFEDLSRVVQLILCASLWARIRRKTDKNFSWIVLDEVAFSLLKTQPMFVDELVSTLRKYYAGAVVVVQDLEKVTSNLAGSSILQNTQSKAILQQRGDTRNFAKALSLSRLDIAAIESLQRKKGVYSDIFLIRDQERSVVRHAPSALEYWLSTSAPDDNRELKTALGEGQGAGQGTYANKLMRFVESREGRSL
jgi:hypothetical protein